MEQQPSIGRVVHYVGIEGQHFAAIITDPAFVVDRDAAEPHTAQALTVLAPNRAPFYVAANYDPAGTAPLTWHWPERV